MVTNYDRAKKWFKLGFSISVNYYNAEHDPDFEEDPDFWTLFEEKWDEYYFRRERKLGEVK